MRKNKKRHINKNTEEIPFSYYLIFISIVILGGLGIGILMAVFPMLLRGSRSPRDSGKLRTTRQDAAVPCQAAMLMGFQEAYGNVSVHTSGNLTLQDQNKLLGEPDDPIQWGDDLLRDNSTVSAAMADGMILKQNAACTCWPPENQEIDGRAINLVNGVISGVEFGLSPDPRTGFLGFVFPQNSNLSGTFFLSSQTNIVITDSDVSGIEFHGCDYFKPFQIVNSRASGGLYIDLASVTASQTKGISFCGLEGKNIKVNTDADLIILKNVNIDNIEIHSTHKNRKEVVLSLQNCTLKNLVSNLFFYTTTETENDTINLHCEALNAAISIKTRSKYFRANNTGSDWCKIAQRATDNFGISEQTSKPNDGGCQSAATTQQREADYESRRAVCNQKGFNIGSSDNGERITVNDGFQENVNFAALSGPSPSPAPTSIPTPTIFPAPVPPSPVPVPVPTTMPTPAPAPPPLTTPTPVMTPAPPPIPPKVDIPCILERVGTMGVVSLFFTTAATFGPSAYQRIVKRFCRGKTDSEEGQPLVEAAQFRGSLSETEKGKSEINEGEEVQEICDETQPHRLLIAEAKPEENKGVVIVFNAIKVAIITLISTTNLPLTAVFSAKIGKEIATKMGVKQDNNLIVPSVAGACLSNFYVTVLILHNFETDIYDALDTFKHYFCNGTSLSKKILFFSTSIAVFVVTLLSFHVAFFMAKSSSRQLVDQLDWPDFLKPACTATQTLATCVLSLYSALSFINRIFGQYKQEEINNFKNQKLDELMQDMASLKDNEDLKQRIKKKIYHDFKANHPAIQAVTFVFRAASLTGILAIGWDAYFPMAINNDISLHSSKELQFLFGCAAAISQVFNLILINWDLSQLMANGVFNVISRIRSYRSQELTYFPISKPEMLRIAPYFILAMFAVLTPAAMLQENLPCNESLSLDFMLAMSGMFFPSFNSMLKADTDFSLFLTDYFKDNAVYRWICDQISVPLEYDEIRKWMTMSNAEIYQKHLKLEDQEEKETPVSSTGWEFFKPRGAPREEDDRNDTQSRFCCIIA